MKTRPTVSSGFLPGPRLTLPPLASGTLDTLRFALKDNIDVCGAVSGAGNPHWAANQPAARVSAPIVDQLLSAGASLAGKTILEELAFSLIGDNRHFPIVHNPASSDRFTGGSSSGSAGVVAAGEVDFALGTDTAGSIRVPASNCGLIGLRPGHGVLNPAGIVPLAPSFDVPGWLARDPVIFRRVGEVLLPHSTVPALCKYSVLQPAMKLLGEPYRAHYRKTLLHLPLDPGEQEPASNPGRWDFALTELAETLRILQADEAWRHLGSWVSNAARGAVSPQIRARVMAGQAISVRKLHSANDQRARLREATTEWLAACGFLVMPTVACPALLKHSSSQQRQEYRKLTVQLTCIASLTGLPEISLPLVDVNGARMGLSVLGPVGSERALLDLANALLCHPRGPTTAQGPAGSGKAIT